MLSVFGLDLWLKMINFCASNRFDIPRAGPYAFENPNKAPINLMQHATCLIKEVTL